MKWMKPFFRILLDILLVPLKASFCLVVSAGAAYVIAFIISTFLWVIPTSLAVIAKVVGLDGVAGAIIEFQCRYAFWILVGIIFIIFLKSGYQALFPGPIIPSWPKRACHSGTNHVAQTTP